MEGGGYFAQFWRGGRNDRYGVILNAYKMSTKGVFLQIRYYQPEFRDMVRQVRAWTREHHMAIIRDEPYRYSEDNPFEFARSGAQKEKEASELWGDAGENPGEMPDTVVSHWKPER